MKSKSNKEPRKNKRSKSVISKFLNKSDPLKEEMESINISNHLDLILGRFELIFPNRTKIPVETITDSEAQFLSFYGNDCLLICKYCGSAEYLAPHEVLQIDECYYCVRLAENLASRSNRKVEEVSHNEVRGAIREIKDFHRFIIFFVKDGSRYRKLRTLIPSIETTENVLTMAQEENIRKPDIELILNQTHRFVIALIIDSLKWVDETNQINETGDPHYPLPWTDDNRNVEEIEMAIGIMEKLRDAAKNQTRWTKTEEGFCGGWGDVEF